MRKPFRKALATALKKAARKEEKLATEIAECGDAEYWLQCGEILKANLSSVERGSDSVELPDMYHPGQTRVIELDPMLKPLQNARRLFKKQRKLLDGLEHKQQELEICRREKETLEKLLSDYSAWEEDAPDDSPPPPELAAAARELRVHVQGLELAPPIEGMKKDKRAPEVSVREFVSADGMKMLVGKTDRDNDRLSLQVARGNDWWFHIAHHPGSHVVVKETLHGRGKEMFLPQETLLDAAHLAVYYSKARNATRAEVHYTQAKHVRKSKGAPAGQVSLQQHKTLSLRLEQTRLDRLVRGNRDQ
jgi:predicted ribosome quality control (RQC) complex YloA/Tae2 family protein